MKQTHKELLRNLFMIVFGSAVFALGFDLFLDPNGINCGGVSGIAMLIVYGTRSSWLTVGMLTVVFNLPLFLLGLHHVGKRFFFGSLLGMAVSSACFDLFALLIPVPEVDPLVASIFGGLMIGTGLGLVFIAEASTGGVDIIARLLKMKLRNLPIGKIILCMDLCTAIATGIVYREFNNTLYSVITLFLSSYALDKVVYGLDYSKVALIISGHHEDISRCICDQLDRGVTLLDGEGYYSHTEKTVLLCAVKRKQLAQLKEIVMTVDPNAFLILQDAHQVLGDGFKRYDRNEL